MPPKRAGLAAPLTKGSVVASDAFFPFADGLLVAIEAGATAVIQPGGSMRDDEVIKAADDHSIVHGFHRHAAFPALSLRNAGPGQDHCSRLAATGELRQRQPASPRSVWIASADALDLRLARRNPGLDRRRGRQHSSPTWPRSAAARRRRSNRARDRAPAGRNNPTPRSPRARRRSRSSAERTPRAAKVGRRNFGNGASAVRSATSTSVGRAIDAAGLGDARRASRVEHALPAHAAARGCLCAPARACSGLSRRALSSACGQRRDALRGSGSTAPAKPFEHDRRCARNQTQPVEQQSPQCRYIDESSHVAWHLAVERVDLVVERGDRDSCRSCA